MAVVVCSFIISACVGSSNSNTATTTPVTPSTPSADIARKINMRSAIYQTFTSSTSPSPNPLSNTLTLTTDSVGTEVFGKYSVTKKEDGTLISAGTVSGSTSKLYLFSSYTTNCKEKLSIYPLDATNASTKVSIQGEDCNGNSIVAIDNIRKVTGSRVVANTLVSNIVDISISAFSADNVTFLGTLNLNNAYLPALDSSTPRRTATATVVGFSTYSSSNSNIVRLVNDGGSYVQLKVTNFSGHLFSPVDVLTFSDNLTTPQTYIRFDKATVGYVDRFIFYPTDTFPLTQSILLGNNPSDTVTTTIPYIPTVK